MSSKLPSTQNSYVAEVIVSDQEALGGNTYVDVWKKGTFALVSERF